MKNFGAYPMPKNITIIGNNTIAGKERKKSIITSR